MSLRQAPRIEPPHVLVAVVLFGYLLVARIVGNLYPFSTYSMYSHHAHGEPSRIVARDATGRLAEVQTFEHWICEPMSAVVADACTDRTRIQSIGYIDRANAEWVVMHAGGASGGEPVDVVRHVWVLRNGRVESARDCLVAHCAATRRP